MKETQGSPLVIASSANWIETQAIDQLRATASLPGMIRAVGMPDLHPGKGSPVGASFLSEGIVYPYLIGGDIGCGMKLMRTDLMRRRANLDRMEKRLLAMGDPDPSAIEEIKKAYGIEPTPFDGALGTIGASNHFAELQAVERIVNEEVAAASGIDRESVYLLVHSGSRGYGASILRDHTDRFRDAGLRTDSTDFETYIARHDNALRWAAANRALIASHLLETLNLAAESVIDIFHNFVEPVESEGHIYWIHRKGAAPSNRGLVSIPGSRGAMTYLIRPVHGTLESGLSVAHGAGRKWDRGSTKGRIQQKYQKKELSRTEIGSRVICTDQNLLYEEAPEAYKNIDIVIQDLVDANLAEVVAVFRPLITFKTNEEAYDK